MHMGRHLRVATAVLLAPLAMNGCGSSSSSDSTASAQSGVHPSVSTTAAAADTTTTAATAAKTDSLCSVLSQDEVARVAGMAVESVDSSDKLQCRWQLSSSGLEDAFELGNVSGTFTFPINTGAGHQLFTALRHIYDTSTPPARYQLVPGVADALILTDPSGYEGVVLVRGDHVFLATPVPGIAGAAELAELLGDRLCNLSGPLNGPC
jgi:hypothetical protein